VKIKEAYAAGDVGKVATAGPPGML